MVSIISLNDPHSKASFQSLHYRNVCERHQHLVGSVAGSTEVVEKVRKPEKVEKVRKSESHPHPSQTDSSDASVAKPV